jgi:lipid-binding SYLF domain-containing protein
MLRLYLLMIGVASLLAAEPREIRRVHEAAGVFDEIMGIRERAIPQELLDRAECVGIVPMMKKGAFIFGGRYGKGVITCRPENGEGWTGPSTIRIEGGSFGLQAGVSEVDLVMLIMNRRGADRLLQSRFTLGGDAAVAAGPVGREASAQTDALMHAEILSWSRSRGAFAGISLAGATLRADSGDNEKIYGKRVTPRQILREGEKPPESVNKLAETLSKYSSRRRG